MANPDTEALSAMGTTLQRNSVEIAEVTNIGGPSLSADTIEATHLKSPRFYREFIGSLRDGGELTFDINMLLANATHNAATGLLAAWTNDGPQPTDDWDLIFPDDDGTTWSFKGIITAYEPTVETDGKLEASLTVKITGAPTLA